ERLAREVGAADAADPVESSVLRSGGGMDRLPEQEAVRFRAANALSFPAGEIHQLRRPPRRDGAPGHEAPPGMSVTFLRLTGPLGVLPHTYPNLILRRQREKDYSLRDWLDLFNHRLVTLFYRAWEKYRLPAAYERAQLDSGGVAPDLATQALYCLVGLGTGGL